MDQIENIFISGDEEHQDGESSHARRVKMGEVFQLESDRFALVCIHCSEEFQYFSEFALHVQDHLQHIQIVSNSTVTKCMSVKQPVKNSPKTQLSDSESIELKVELQNFESNDDDDGDFDAVNCADFSDENSDTDEPIKATKIKEEVHTNTPSTQTEPEHNVHKDNEKKIQKPSSTTLKRKSNISKYQQLLTEFENFIDEPANQMAFDVFKQDITLSIFPSNVRDTTEIRMLAKYAIRGNTYKKKDNKLLCPICDTGFKDTDTVRRHILTHLTEAIFECGLCQALFRAPRYLRNHLNKEHLSDNRTFECFYCHETFKHHRQLANHIVVHRMDLKCVMCDKKFKIQSTYDLHMQQIHGKNGVPIKYENQLLNLLPVSYKEKPTITAYQCYICKKNFRERRQLRNHMKIHVQQPQLCLLCGILCSGATSMHRHMKLHYPDETKSHVCTICGKGFKIRQYMLRHRRKEHQVWADNQRPTCQVCGTTFDKKCLLHEHMKSHPFEESRNYICTICNHAARNPYNLRRHMLTHSQERSFQCNICHKTFREFYAKDHMKTHEEIRKHKCPVCGKKFKRPYALKQHMYQHGGAPEHKCDICQKGFTRTDKLLRHRRRHGIPLNYHCRHCSKGFISQKSFELHENACPLRDRKFIKNE